MKNWFARRVDANQPELVRDLRKMGYAVQHTHILGKGVPDLIVSNSEQMRWVEVKMPGEELNPREKQWFENWRGLSPIIAERAEDVQRAFGKK